MEFQHLQDNGRGRVPPENLLPATYGTWTLFSSCLGQLEGIGGSDAHLRLNQALDLLFSAFGLIVLLAYILSRVYLTVKIFLVIPYMDPGVYRETKLRHLLATFWLTPNI